MRTTSATANKKKEQYSAVVWHRGLLDTVVAAVPTRREWHVWTSSTVSESTGALIGAALAAAAPGTRWSNAAVAQHIAGWGESRRLPGSYGKTGPELTVMDYKADDPTTRALVERFRVPIAFLITALCLEAPSGWTVRALPIGELAATDARDSVPETMQLSPTTIEALGLVELVKGFFPTLTTAGSNMLFGWFCQPLCTHQAIQRRQRAVAQLRTSAYLELRSLLRAVPRPGTHTQLSAPGLTGVLRRLGGLRRVTQHCLRHGVELDCVLVLRAALRCLQRWQGAVHQHFRLEKQGLTPAPDSDLAGLWAHREVVEGEINQAVKAAWRDFGPKRGKNGRQPAYEWVHGRLVLPIQQRHMDSLRADAGVVLGRARSTVRWAPHSLVGVADRWRAANEAIAEQTAASLRELETAEPSLRELLAAATQQLAELDALAALAHGVEEHNLVAVQLGETVCLREAWCLPLRQAAVASDLVLDWSATHTPFGFGYFGGSPPTKTPLRPNRSVCLTGSNTAGKSTTMRMLCQAVLLHQVGCGVPARDAVLPLYDTVAFRRGTNDDAARGLSSFVAQMVETAAIVRCARPRSLLCFDELGAATSTTEGAALAQAVVEHLSQVVGCTVLCSTHFAALPAVCGLRLGVREDHSLQADAVLSADALSVAACLGLHPSVLDFAYKVKLGHTDPRTQTTSDADTRGLCHQPSMGLGHDAA